MKIFVSHSHAQKDDADTLALALRGAGHEVFLDRDNLPPGSEYNAALRKALQGSDLVLFMVTPAAMKRDSFALAEVEFARLQWPNPVGHVLAVMWEDTPAAMIPAYLLATTVRKPIGKRVAMTVAWVDAMAPPPAPAPVAEPVAEPQRRNGRRLLLLGAAALLAVAAVVVVVQRPPPAACLLRLSVLAAPEPASTAHLPSLDSRRSFTVIDGVALLDFVGLTAAPAQWTLQLVLADGRLGGRFEARGCPTHPEDLDDGRGTRIRIEPRL